MAYTEADLLAWFRRTLPARGAVEVSAGHDAALVRLLPGRRAVLKTDATVEGVHFTRGRARPEAVGWKAVCRCVSDLAAMGARPLAAAVSLTIPRGLPLSFLRRLYAGMRRAGREYGAPLCGGDLSSSAGPLVIAVSMLGEEGPRPPALRSGARPGDEIAVTGTFGGSSLRKHLSFRPRLVEGLLLTASGPVHALMDVSDGLLLDLSRLLDASGVDAEIHASRVPVSPAARRLARRDGRTPLDHALADGEDFELLFAIAPRDLARLLRERPFTARITQIGRVLRKGAGRWLVGEDGRRRRLRARGWDAARGA